MTFEYLDQCIFLLVDKRVLLLIVFLIEFLLGKRIDFRNIS